MRLTSVGDIGHRVVPEMTSLDGAQPVLLKAKTKKPFKNVNPEFMNRFLKKIHRPCCFMSELVPLYRITTKKEVSMYEKLLTARC